MLLQLLVPAIPCVIMVLCGYMERALHLISLGGLLSFLNFAYHYFWVCPQCSAVADTTASLISTLWFADAVVLHILFTRFLSINSCEFLMCILNQSNISSVQPSSSSSARDMTSHTHGVTSLALLCSVTKLSCLSSLSS